MRFKQALWCVALGLIPLSGCHASDSEVSPPITAPPPDAEPIGKAQAISFDPGSTLTLAPGDKASLKVVVEPIGIHQVRFSLVGDSLDASLDSDLLQTTAEGIAAVLLTAPQTATAFRVRAAADEGPTAEVEVSVSGTGFATLTLTPSYTGKRSTPQWVGTATALVACADKKGVPPPDGPLITEANAGAPLVLDGLPAGPKLAITLRSGNSVGGCTDIVRLNPGEQRSLSVKVSDRPIDLGKTESVFTALLQPDGSALKPWLDTATSDFVNRFAPQGDESGALLDTMEALAPSSAEFASARTSGDWDKSLQTYLDKLGKPLGERLRTWAAKGSMLMLSGEAFTGSIAANPQVPGHPTLEVKTLGGLDAGRVGPSYPYTSSLSADPGDVIHVGGSIFVLPSAFIAAAIDQAVETATVPSALAVLLNAVSCSEVASALEASGDPPSSCLTDCLEKLCKEGLTAMWQRAREGSANSFEAASLSFTIAADAKVDSEAVITSWEGSWAGELVGKSATLSVKGTAKSAASK